MVWAGYIEEDADGLAPNAKRALSMLGDDFTEDELRVMKAVLDTLRKKVGFSAARHRTDRPLSVEDHQAIRGHAMALLREIDGLKRSGPVDLEAAYATAKLVQVGAIELSAEDRRRLRRRFGDLVDGALKRLAGVLHIDTGEVYVNADLHALKKRFVLGHEAGHAVLPDHQIVFAHLDDKRRLTPDFNDLLERQANQFSVELLAKGDRLRKEFDDSAPTRGPHRQPQQQVSDVPTGSSATRRGRERARDRGDDVLPSLLRPRTADATQAVLLSGLREAHAVECRPCANRRDTPSRRAHRVWRCLTSYRRDGRCRRRRRGERQRDRRSVCRDNALQLQGGQVSGSPENRPIPQAALGVRPGDVVQRLDLAHGNLVSGSVSSAKRAGRIFFGASKR